MRIALLAPWASAMAGGAAAYVGRLTTLLAEFGHSVLLIHADEAARLDAGDPPTVQRLHVPRFDAVTAPPEAAGRVLEQLSAFAPDVVHVHDLANVPLMRELAARHVLVKSTHGHSDHCPAGTRLIDGRRHLCGKPLGPLCLPYMAVRRCHPSRNPRTLLELYQLTRGLHAFDHELPQVCVASRYARDRLVDSGLDPERIAVVPYFSMVPPAAVAAAEAAAREAQRAVAHQGEAPRGRVPTVLFTGRIVREKGLVTLLEALASIDTPYRLVVDGTGPAEEEARALANRLGLQDRVAFLGWCPPDQHWRNFAEADIVAVPSLWPEPFGLVGLEAMTFAKPVVAFAVGGIPDWLSHGESGYLAERQDRASLATHLASLLRNVPGAKRMGERGRQLLERDFSAAAHVRHLESAYAEAGERRAYCTSRTP